VKITDDMSHLNFIVAAVAPLLLTDETRETRSDHTLYYFEEEIEGGRLCDGGEEAQSGEIEPPGYPTV
jgi:hypothetical protein